MLVIGRREGESILVGDQVEIEIIEVGPNRVKLGVRAPREIIVMRKELQLIRNQNLAAARFAPSLSEKILKLLEKSRPASEPLKEESSRADK